MNFERRSLAIAPALAILAAVATTACTQDPEVDPPGISSNSNTSSDATSDGTSDGSSDGTSSSSSGDDSTDFPVDPDCGNFLGCSGDVPGPGGMFCNFWDQDCPEGEKCTAIPSTPGSGSWDANVCVPAGTEPPGSACQLADGPQGSDTCDISGMCYDIDPDTMIGTCVEFCQAPMNSPTCPQSGAGVSCSELNGGILNLCLTPCNPLLTGECPVGQNCVAAFEGQELGGFICFPPAAEGVSGEECSCANCCAQGHMCVGAAEYGPGCPFDACCTEYCDVNDGGFDCAGAGQSCVALFPSGTPGLDTIGQCIVTQ